VLPPGLAGGIAVLTNWTYSLFYVCAELWGDVILSLLFWGMANETTRIQDAGTIYPLLGVGANVVWAHTRDDTSLACLSKCLCVMVNVLTTCYCAPCTSTLCALFFTALNPVPVHYVVCP